MLAILPLLLIFTQSECGYLSVSSESKGMSVYVNNDSIGITPVDKYPLKPGKYTVSFFTEDSFDIVYNQIKHGSITKKLSGLWLLARYDAGTQRVSIEPDSVIELFISKKEIDKALGKAKRTCLLGVGGIFVTGLISGILLSQVF